MSNESIKKLTKYQIARRKYILNKADNYSIPYDNDENKINFRKLGREVEIYEYMVQMLEMEGTHWDKSIYDPVKLNKLVESIFECPIKKILLGKI